MQNTYAFIQKTVTKKINMHTNSFYQRGVDAIV